MGPPDPRDPQTYAVIGAAMAVHQTLGPGLLEAAYREAMTFALAEQHIPFAIEVPFWLSFHGHRLRTSYRADFVCWDRIIVELKALGALSGAEVAQVLNYLKVSGLPVGLLLNFGTPSLQYRRFVLSPASTSG